MTLCLVLASTLFTTAQVRNLPTFSAMNVATGVTATLKQSDETRVEIKVENCDPDDVLTEVRGNKLEIRFKSNSNRKNRGRKAHVFVYYQDLQDISVSSGATIESGDLMRTDELRLRGSSGGHLHLKVDAKSMDVNVSSGAVVKIQGRATNLDINVSSGGVLSAEEMDSEYADADASSGGVAKFAVHKGLSANASSGGSIRYAGNPEKLKVHSSVAGSVRAQ